MDEKSMEDNDLDENKDDGDLGDIQRAAEISPNKRFYRVGLALQSSTKFWE